MKTYQGLSEDDFDDADGGMYFELIEYVIDHLIQINKKCVAEGILLPAL